MRAGAEYNPEVSKFAYFDLHKLSTEKPITPYPVVLAIGAGNGADAYRVASMQLREEGFTVLSPDYKYGVPGEPKTLGVIPNVNKLKEDSIAQTVRMEGHLGENGTYQAIFVTHSKGFLDVVAFALRNPDAVRSIVAVGPAGLHTKKNLLKSISDLREADRQDGLDKEKRRAEEPGIEELILDNEIFKDWWKNENSLRYKAEGLSIATKTVQDKLSFLRSRGIDITIILPDNDSMFSPSESERVLRPGTVNEVIHIPGIHGEIKYNAQVARLIAEVIKKTENINPSQT